jgi:hypothetical protein
VIRLALAASLVVTATASAEPLRLRADALAETASPVGLLVLSSDGAVRPWLSAEAVVWLGTDGGEALVIALRARLLDDRVLARLGRFVAAVGAVRPVHVDGLAATVRLPWRFEAEVFGGMPVAPGLSGRGWDWLVGGRLARRLGDWGSAGIAYLHRRDHGRLSSEELGLDAGAAVGERSDLAGRLAWDLASPGLAEVHLTASRRFRKWRGELHGGYRSPSHLLPATSLFAVIGDLSSWRSGAGVTFWAAPRLDLTADATALVLDEHVALEATLRARLRLDAKGEGALGAELRRGDGWTGVRGTSRLPLVNALTLAMEVELAVPDEPAGRGSVWPWGLVALSWRRGPWDAAVAVEASASPEHRRRLDVLAQLARRWELP